MINAAPPLWLSWAREIQALAQTGNHYAVNEYEHERYHRLAQIAAEMISHSAGLDYPPLADAFHAQVGYATPRVDLRTAAFFSLAEIPSALSGERTLPRHIQDAYAALADPAMPTVFD
jgi:hypothetical protein